MRYGLGRTVCEIVRALAIRRFGGLETWAAGGGLSPPDGVDFFVVRDGTGYYPWENRKNSLLCA